MPSGTCSWANAIPSESAIDPILHSQTVRQGRLSVPLRSRPTGETHGCGDVCGLWVAAGFEHGALDGQVVRGWVIRGLLLAEDPSQVLEITVVAAGQLW